ncbi:MAG TPA: methyltransferase [Candidatus Binatia bacterium]|nr:methyltransferase [Candidatus Binatia bacterium]
MRLGVIAETIIERLVLKSNVAPEPLLETQMAFSMARSIMVGVKLGLFEAVSDGARSAADIAKTCATDPVATEKLLNALAGCGYFKFRNGAYRLTAKAKKWLLRRSPQNLCDKLLFQFYEWDMVEGYEAFVRSGKPMAGHEGMEGSDFWSSYQRGMRNLAGLAAGEVTNRFPMPPGARDMLDIGGSHGYFSVSLCRKHANLKSVVLDLPDAVAQAAPILAQEKMGERVTHRPGNVLTDELGEQSVDIAFMSQLVHHFTDEQNRDLMKKIARALRPGGVCVMLDSIRLQKPGDGSQTAGLLDLYFAMMSESGTWPIETMQDWLQSTGLKPLKPIWLRTMPAGALVAGRKAG